MQTVFWQDTCMVWAHSFLQYNYYVPDTGSDQHHGTEKVWLVRPASDHYLFMTCVYTDTSSPSGSCTNYDQWTRPICRLFVLELKLWLLLSTPLMAMCISLPMAAPPPLLPSPHSFLFFPPQTCSSAMRSSAKLPVTRHWESFSKPSKKTTNRYIRSCWHDVIITHLMTSYVSLCDVIMM